eukprot:GHVL01021352.1.p1 GENE.GHVL01021352.1~~GHVL01021352.1.p1  ORF type:complete len:183 (-),score=22.41 GHVL01021352.1:95-643(-)
MKSWCFVCLSILVNQVVIPSVNSFHHGSRHSVIVTLRVNNVLKESSQSTLRRSSSPNISNVGFSPMYIESGDEATHTLYKRTKAVLSKYEELQEYLLQHATNLTRSLTTATPQPLGAKLSAGYSLDMSSLSSDNFTLSGTDKIEDTGAQQLLAMSSVVVFFLIFRLLSACDNLDHRSCVKIF